MNEGGSRRAVAEIRFGEDRIGITKVGGRSIHQYWTLLGPHFRDVLLAPQRRSDDGGVAWTWREATDKKPLTASEFASVRKRLERANESFAENPVSPLMGEARTGTRSQALIDQVATKVKAMAESLAAKSDAALAEFVCRTETGVMVHSWGVASPAAIVYPDSLETGVGGVVLVGEKPAEGHEVVIENAKGLSVARMQSDEAGEFHFSKIGPGRYRVRVVSGRVKFPAKGVMVTVERGAVARVELVSSADSSNQDDGSSTPPISESTETSPASTDSTPPQDRGVRSWLFKTAVALLLLLLLVGGGVWGWKKWSSSGETDERLTVRTSSMAPEDFSTGANSISKPDSLNTSVGDSANLGVSADGVRGVAHQPAAHARVTSSRGMIAPTAEKSLSTIGSKVEVLSGVADTRSKDDKSAADPAAQSAPSGEATEQQSTPGQTNLVQDVGSTKASTSPRKKNPGVVAAGGPISGRAPQGGDAQAGEAEAVSVENKKPLQEAKSVAGTVTMPSAKKQAKAPAQGAVLVGEPRADSSAPQDEASISGPAPDALAPDGVTVTKSDGGLPREKAPTSKVSVMRKGSSDGSPSPASDAGSEDSAADAVGNDSPAPKVTATKRGKSTFVAGASAPVDGGPAVGDASSSTASEQNDATTVAPLSEKKQETKSTSVAFNKAVVDSPTGNSPGLSDSASTANTPERLAPATARSVSAKTSSRHSVSGSAEKPTNSDQNARQDGMPEDDSSRPKESIDNEQLKTDKTAVESGTRTKMLTAEILGTRWEVRLLRDTIVPTLPVHLGEDDTADLVREKILAEQKARLPVTFRYPATQRGLVFEFPEVASARAFYWQDTSEAEAVIRTTTGNRAEILWPGETPPHESVQVLRFSDGREAVRLTVNEKGTLVLKVTEGLRSSVLLLLKCSVADESGLAKRERESRFEWQVNGVKRLPLGKALDPALGSKDHRISLPLELSKSGKSEVALTDRISGWALVTIIQLQPLP